MPDSPRPIGDDQPDEPDARDERVPAAQGGEPEEPSETDLAQMLSQVLGDTDNPQLAEALSAMGIDKLDPATMGLIATQLKAMFTSNPGQPFNVELATDVARKTVAAGGDASVGPAERREVEEAAHVAGLWLDAVTTFSSPGVAARAWSRAEWVEQTMPVWRHLVEPVASGVGAAIVSALHSQLGGAADSALGGMPGMPAGIDPAMLMAQMEPMLARMSGSMFGMQVGQAVGTLAADLVSGTEVGLPLVPDDAVVLLPANVAAFAEGLEVDLSQVRLFLAVRESARVRLFAEVPWLGPQLLAAVQAYARDISIDTEGIQSALQSVDPSDPAAMQQALAGSLFTPDPSAAQKAALQRLETYLALVEGWVDVVAEQATRSHLPQASALGEAVRRRRASGGPAEQIFSGLVGLELRPRRLRDAVNLWAALEASGGVSTRDAAWAHPDVSPTAADLDDPLGYVERVRTSAGGDDMDAALTALLTEDDSGDSPQPGR